jgi:acyl transferase domain-containing protein
MTRASGGGSLIAVVGMSCRLPRASNSEAYWKLLTLGQDAVSDVPRGALGAGGANAVGVVSS